MMEPLPPPRRPNSSPRPKNKFSFRNLRSRFASTSNLHEDVAAGHWDKLYPKTAHGDSFNPYDLVHPQSPATPDSPSPSLSPHPSFKDKHLPPVPHLPHKSHSNGASQSTGYFQNGNYPQHPQPQPDSQSPPDPSDLPWVSRFQTQDYVPLSDGVTRQEAEFSKPLALIKSIEHEEVSTHADTTVVATQTVVSVMSGFDTHATLHKMKGGINDLPVEIPGLINVLDEVSKIHVSISVVVLAFKAAYNMEKTRRENDKRILMLYVAMKDMLSVLIQLRDVRDPYQLGLDGHPIQPRLESVAKMAAQDIKNCANTCDTYLKKTLMVKVLRSQVWETRLASFIRVFAQRRQDFEFALIIHTANAVDSVGVGVKELNDKVTELTSMIIDVFHREWTPVSESQLAKKVKEKGGLKFVENSDAALSELAGLDSGGTAEKTGGVNAMLQGRSVKEATLTLQDLKDELHEGLEAAVQKNMETFEGKFALYQRQLQEELARFIREENNRIVDELNKGPHDKIKDEELKAIWKEMDWKLNVKARLFVMTLRDHYRDKADSAVMSAFSPGASADDWAFEFINAKYLQPIMEAFDDDGSGYVTYQEVNEFVDARPVELNWSLPHWVAYWAIGWQATSAKYGEHILELLSHLFAIRSTVLPENRYWVDYYLKTVWPVAFELIKSFRPANVPDHIEAKFKDYAEYEENRIRKNLEDIRFDIDALDTVYVVAGPGRIEKYLFPMVYLLLKRDVEVFHLARRKILHKEELLDSADSLLWVFRAVNYRYLDLSVLFKQNQLNVDSQMKVAACGLFDYLHNSAPLWTWRNMEMAAAEAENPSEIDFEQFEKASLDVLNHPLKDDHRFKCELYESETSTNRTTWEFDARAALPVRALLGEWNGYIYTDELYPSQLMVSFRIHATSTSTDSFTASGMHDGVTFQVSGRCSMSESGVLRLQFAINYSREYSTQYFTGHLDNAGTIVGTEGWDEDEELHDHKFFLKRHLARRFLRYRPKPSELEENRARALWQFATSAVLHHVRRQNWTWDYINERREMRQRYIELSIRFTTYGHRPNKAELVEWTDLQRCVAPIDASFFRILREHQLKTIPSHDCQCRTCGAKIGGARVVCLDCLASESDAKTVDFCDNPSCWKTTFSVDIRDPEKRHLPTHDVFKVRTVLHLRDVPAINELARNALSVAREYFTSSTIVEVQEPSSAKLGGAFDADALEATLASYFEEKPEHTLPSNGPSVQCQICQTFVEQPCWYCADCFSSEEQIYICDDCENKTLLRCTHCDRAYKQPTWYYGAHAVDNFLCSTCTARRVDSRVIEKSKQHTYLHTLVRCTRKVEFNTKSAERTAEERMMALEQTVWSLTGKVGRVEDTLGRIERLLLASLARNKSTCPNCPHCHNKRLTHEAEEYD